MVWKIASSSGRSTIWRSGKTRRMPSRKISHSCVPWKSSHMKKPPRRRYSRKAATCLSVSAQWPTSTRVEPGPVELVALVEVDGLLDGADVDAREAADGLHDVAVGAGVVDGPVGGAAGPIVAVTEAPAVPRIHEAGEDELGFFVPVGREREASYSTPGNWRKGRWKAKRADAEQDGDAEEGRRVASMRHRIVDVVHGYADAQGGELFGVLGIVGVLPGIAQIHVVADGDHEAALVVVDAAPGGAYSRPARR